MSNVKVPPRQFTRTRGWSPGPRLPAPEELRRRWGGSGAGRQRLTREARRPACVERAALPVSEGILSPRWSAGGPAAMGPEGAWKKTGPGSEYTIAESTECSVRGGMPNGATIALHQHADPPPPVPRYHGTGGPGALPGRSRQPHWTPRGGRLPVLARRGHPDGLSVGPTPPRKEGPQGGPLGGVQPLRTAHRSTRRAHAP